MDGFRACWCGVLVVWAMCSPLQAELTRFEIQSREPFAGGSEFGPVGGGRFAPVSIWGASPP